MLGPELLIPAVVVAMTAYVYALALIVRLHANVPRDPPPRLLFVVLVPCLNEGLVIGRTVRSLLRMRGDARVVVIDDDSDDGSLDALRPLAVDRRLQVLRRKRPEARLGKGEALNAGYWLVREMATGYGYRADQIIVCVFDSDGRADEDFLMRVAPYFADPDVTGVQSAVRMYNASQNLLTRWQDIEFIIWGEVFSRAKDWIGSATLGGNGQFVRLSALRDIGHRPWRPSLTEDLDLSLRLILHGGRLRFCPTAAVFQQAVPSLRALLRQRARWLQGHLVAMQYLGSLARSPLPRAVRGDLVIFLMLPALFVPIGLGAVASWLTLVETFGQWSLADILRFYVFAFPLAPLLVAVIRRRYAETRGDAIREAHLYFAYSGIWLVAAVAATWHIIAGRRGWAKTGRVAEQPENPN